jgi:hypothetical protein
LSCCTQYYIDAQSQTLYFFPPIPLEQWTEGPFITQNLYAADISGTSHVTLRGLGIHNSRGNGLLAFNVTGVRVEDCEISGHGQHGVVMNGTDSGVRGSNVHSVGCSGIRVAGGIGRTLEAGEMFVTHNRISNFSLVKRTYVPGIFWQGVGNNYSHNFITNGPHNCILGGGNENWPWDIYNTQVGSGSQCLFDSNTLDTCAYECTDCGAFYTCGEGGNAWVNRGNVVRNTTFLDSGATAIYLDDMMSGWTVLDSVVDGAAVGIQLGGGRRNLVLNSRFRNIVGSAVVLLNAGLNFAYKDCKSTAKGSMTARVKELLYPGSPWVAEYPELLNVTTDAPCTPAYSQVTGNWYDEATVKNFLESTSRSSWPSWHVTVANNTNGTMESSKAV